jgi:epoxide hydrolase-like predicted phosphatase
MGERKARDMTKHDSSGENERTSDSRKIVAGIFDFSGVMTTSPLEGVHAYEDSLGLERGSLLKLIMGDAYEDGDDPWHKLERGEIPGKEFWESLKQRAREELEVELSMSDFFRTFLQNYRPREKMVELVKSLKGTIRTGLLTNNVREFSGFWRAMLPVEEIFDEIIDSSEVGLRKPDPRVYELALERLGAEPSSAFFVDDFAVNVDAARKLGLEAILFTDEDSVIERIRSLVFGEA